MFRDYDKNINNNVNLLYKNMNIYQNYKKRNI